MLSQFTSKRHFSGVDVSIYVDCEAKLASAMVKYQGRIAWQGSVAFWEVQTPEHAERYMSRPMGETGSWLEDLHYQATRQTGVFAPKLEA